MNQQPAISILLPVYNAAPYLAQTLESLLAQSFGDFELIVINDGSTDQTLEIIEQFARRDTRLRVISRENRGIVRTLNEGIELARGTYIARMDGDDQAAPHRLELQIKRMNDDPSLVVLGSSAIATDPQGRKLGVFPLPLSHEEIEQSHLKGISSIYHPAAMIRTAALRQVGGYRDLCPVEDLDLWLRLGEIGRVGNLSEPLLIWRQTAAGLTAAKAQIHQQKLRQVMQEAWQRRSLPGQPVIPPTQHDMTPLQWFERWGWMALGNQQVQTARYYARQVVKTHPLRLRSWRLMLCALRGS